jgi:hypothetical protein
VTVHIPGILLAGAGCRSSDETGSAWAMIRRQALSGFKKRPNR